MGEVSQGSRSQWSSYIFEKLSSSVHMEPDTSTFLRPPFPHVVFAFGGCLRRSQKVVRDSAQPSTEPSTASVISVIVASTGVADLGKGHGEHEVLISPHTSVSPPVGIHKAEVSP